MRKFIKFPLFLGMFISIFGPYKASAETIKKTCPAGLFCTSGGKYTFDTKNGDIERNMIEPADQILDGWGVWSDQGLCDSCAKSRSGCTYCANEYDEAWVSTAFGFYFIKNNEPIYHSSKAGYIKGVFPCPGTYPSSAEGASSVFECYKVIGNGQKEYYKAPTNTQNTSSVNYNIDAETVNALVKDLQSALIKAQALQEALNQGNTTQPTISSKPDLDVMKAMIKAGVSNPKSVSSDKIPKVRK